MRQEKPKNGWCRVRLFIATSYIATPKRWSTSQSWATCYYFTHNWMRNKCACVCAVYCTCDLMDAKIEQPTEIETGKNAETLNQILWISIVHFLIYYYTCLHSVCLSRSHLSRTHNFFLLLIECVFSGLRICVVSLFRNIKLQNASRGTKMRTH